jgi:sugar/nucleoside kinase (ribokinase family)
MEANPVLVIGSVAFDTVKTTRVTHEKLLGGAASFAGVAASFYAPVRIVAVIGDDFPDSHMAVLKRKGIDLKGIEVVKGGKTFHWAGEYEEDMNIRRTLQLDLNVFADFKPKLPPDWRQTRYVHLGNINPELQMEVLNQLHEPKFVSLDTIDFWIETARANLLKVLKRVDVLLINDAEARMLTGEHNLIRAGKKVLEMGPRYFILKKGEHGCILFSKDETFSVGAFPLENVVDPTGAGDCFAGGLIGHLAANDDTSFNGLKHAAVQGTMIASFCVEEFSLHRLDKLDRKQIEERWHQFLAHTHLQAFQSK